MQDSRMPRDTPAPFEEVYRRFAPLMLKIATKKFGIARAEAEQLVYAIFVTYLTHEDEVEQPEGYFIGSICDAARNHRR
jgi:hypothetical protein